MERWEAELAQGRLDGAWDAFLDRYRRLIFAAIRLVSRRRSVHDAWSEPQNLGAPVNTPVDEISARLSRDGRTLLITSARPGGLGGTLFGFDIWMATRTPSGH